MIMKIMKSAEIYENPTKPANMLNTMKLLTRREASLESSKGFHVGSSSPSPMHVLPVRAVVGHVLVVPCKLDG